VVVDSPVYGLVIRANRPSVEGMAPGSLLDGEQRVCVEVATLLESLRESHQLTEEFGRRPEIGIQRS